MKTILLGLLIILAGCGAGSSIPMRATATVSPDIAADVRVAIIGGMMETGFWDELAARFEKASGHPVKLVASGPKEDIYPPFVQGKADLIVMHASDTIINLVADGYAVDPQPWCRNSMAIVGPKDDPAKIKGLTDAAEALRRIASSKSRFVVHSSLGAQEVLRDIMDSGHITLDPENTTVLFDDKARRIMKVTADMGAYTMVGRIPFLTGKLPSAGMEMMVQDDPKLRRPFLVAVANPARFPGSHTEAARSLGAFLRLPETQEWIANFGKGKFDANALFYPVNVAAVPAH